MALYPGSPIVVHNKGISGEIAWGAYARFASDVYPQLPQLVIWQVGTNDALYNVDLSRFKRTLTEGCNDLRGRGIEVVLMEPQFYNFFGESEQYRGFVTAVRDVARQLKVAVVPRYDIIRREIMNGNTDVWSSDVFHLSDEGYGLVADYVVTLITM